MKNPYTVTTLVFLAITAIGGFFLNWDDQFFTVILILYFIVTIGIKLDEIAGLLGAPSREKSAADKTGETVIAELQKINAALAGLDRSISRLTGTLDKIDGKDAPAAKPIVKNAENDYRP